MFLPPGPQNLTLAAIDKEVDETLAQSASLTDYQKVRVEYWSDGPASETPPGHWCLFAQAISRKDGHTLDQDAKLFFALSNAMLDASIAAWSAKRRWDYVRPITAVRTRRAGQWVLAWGGPYQGPGSSGRELPALPADDLADPAVPRVRVRPQHLQRGRRPGLADVHRQRPVRRPGDHPGRLVAYRAARHSGDPDGADLADLHQRA
jgi:hypothetical protein